MSKELEALKRLYGQVSHTLQGSMYVQNGKNLEDYKTIETALKDYEELKSRENNVLPNDEFIGDLGEHTRDEIAIKLKALEIIKKCCLLGSYPNGTYELAFSTKIDITKEEYDLLKEIIKWKHLMLDLMGNLKTLLLS